MPTGLRGAPTYHGAPCRRCRGTERYVRGKHCIACMGRRNASERAERAKANGAVEATEWTAKDDELLARGRCACGLTLPCYGCPKEKGASEYLGRRGEPSYSNDSGRR